jgi:hypothetical protein
MNEEERSRLKAPCIMTDCRYFEEYEIRVGTVFTVVLPKGSRFFLQICRDCIFFNKFDHYVKKEVKPA